MTKHIQIPPQANAEAARRMLAQARDKRVVLELPEGWTELDNMARMRLLQRQAQLLRMDVALVTRHDATRKTARQVGIPVFYRLEDAAKDGWRMKPLLPLINPKAPDAGLPDAPHWRRGDVMTRVRRATVRRSRQQRIQAEERYRRPTPIWMRWLWNTLAGLLMVLFLAGFTLYVLPAATVTVTPGREPISVSVRLVADPALDAADFDRNRLPARLLETNIVQQGSRSTSGSRQIAAGNASGRVTFTNQGPEPVLIPDGTVVSTVTGAQVRFRTLGEVTAPGGVGQRVDAVIEALEPGIDGNVLANTIGNISGALRFRLRVTNSQGTGGGGAALVNVVTQEDRDLLLAETTTRAEGDAYRTLQESTEPGEWLPEESVQTYVIAQAFGQFNDEEADELTLDLRVLAQGTAVEDALSTQAALTQLRQAIPEMGQLVADSITYRREPGAVAVGRAVEFTVTASAEYIIPIDAAEVRGLIAGMRPADAIAALQQRWQLARPPSIYRDPELLPTLPTLPNRIQVRVEYEGALEGVAAEQRMDKFLALDVGKARIGVATGDPLGITVRPVAVVRRTSNRADFAQLARLVQTTEATAIVCGLPLNMDGSEGEQAQWTRKWAMRLAHALRAALGRPVPIVFWDERLSSFAAQEHLAESGAEGADDAVAAAVILRSYLTAQKQGQAPDWGRIELESYS